MTINEVRERSLPELNDEFAQSLPDGYENMEALRNAVKEAMAAGRRGETETGRYETDVIKALIDEADITIPPVMLENETNRILNGQEQMLESANIRMDDYLRSVGRTEEEIHHEAEEEAERRIRRTFALNKVSELENIEVTEQEIDERFQPDVRGDSA